MKKRLSKIISILSVLILCIASMSAKEVHAVSQANNIEWDIEISQVGEAKRLYFDKDFRFLSSDLQRCTSGQTYDVNAKEVAIQTRLINDIGDIYVSVDGSYIGNANETLIDFIGDKSLNYTTFVAKHLTPGQHKIEVKVDSPDYMSTEQKIDFIYVNMLPYEDEEIDKSIENIKNGIATLYDYEVVGVNAVNDKNIQAVNNVAKGKDLNANNVQSSIIEIANQVNDQIKLKDAFTRINSGTGTLNDYKTIGVVNVTSSNLSGVNVAVKNARNNKNDDLTKDEIQSVVNDLPNIINDANTRINAGTALLIDYPLVGVTGVTDINLVDVNEYVKGKDNSTVSKLQTNVNTMVNALASINQGSTSTTYYTKLGITTVTSDNITAISKNVVAAKSAKGSNLTKAEIQKVVEDSLVSITDANAKINAGIATLDDYASVDITGVTEINLVDVNEYVKGKDNSTKSKLQTNVNAMGNALSYINTGTTVLSYYSTLGITTVTGDNVSVMKQNIVAAKTAKGINLTKAEIKKVVEDSLVNIADANARINAGTAALEDYASVGVTGVTEINLTDVNDYVKGKDNSTKSKLKTNVTAMVNALSAINKGTTTVSYYTTLGITTVTADNSNIIKQSILLVRDTKGINLTKAEIKKVVEDSLVNISYANARINTGIATLDDYESVDITGVTEINLEDVNEYVKGKDNSTKSKLQTNVSTMVNALASINQGNTSTTYYIKLGITTLTSDNITVISKNVVAAKSAKGSNLTKAEIQKVVEDSLVSITDANAKINAGTATLDDYASVDITGVTEINLVDVNEYVKGKDNSTRSKLQTNVTAMVNALSAINKGTTTVSYYTTLGITTVTSGNSSVIKQNILTAKTEKGSNLTKAEIKKVVEDTLKVNTTQSASIDKQEAIVATNLMVTQQVDNFQTDDIQKDKDKTTKSIEKINSGQATLEDYEIAGILRVTNENLDDVNNEIKSAKDIKGSNLTKVEIIELVKELINKVNDSEEIINLIEPTEEIVKVDENNDIKQNESLNKSVEELEISNLH